LPFVAVVPDATRRAKLPAPPRKSHAEAGEHHKIGVKRDPLQATDAKRRQSETHTIKGERMLHRVGGLLGSVGRIIRSCHERYDGSGYPDGLAGEQIPLVARIVACCDAFNAMTTDRPYRAALLHADAVGELQRNRGTQFDPRVVDALMVTLERRESAGVPLAAASA